MFEEEVISKFQECEIKLSICPEGGEKENFSFRAFVINDLGEIARDAIEAFTELAYHAADEEEAESYGWVLKMLSFYDAIPELDPQRERSFDPATLRRQESLQELIKFSGSVGQPIGENLESLTGDVTASIPELFADAIYEDPHIEIDLLSDEYSEFRDSMLDDLLDLRKQISDEGKQVLLEMCDTELLKPNLPCEAIEYYVDLKAKLNQDDLPENIEEVNERLEIETLRNAVRIEEEKMQRFQHIARLADDLLSTVWDEIEWGEDDFELPADYEAQLQLALTKIDLKLVNDLLDMTCDEYQVAYPSCTSDEKSEEWEQAYAGQFEMFKKARKSSDKRMKFDVIYWISTNLINRNSMIPLMLREAEDIQLEVLSWYFKNVYRAIRHKLTYFERRVFKLMYWRWPFTGYRIAALDFLTQGFLSGMDDDTRALVCLNLVYKRESIEGCKIGDVVERRWKSYLRFYPSWVELIRSEEREKKRENSVGKKKAGLHELENVSAKSEDNALVGSTGIEFHPRELAAFLADLSISQQRVIRARFFDGKSQEEIASEEGITQQAVSKRIRAGINKLKKAIEERKESAA